MMISFVVIPAGIALAASIVCWRIDHPSKPSVTSASMLPRRLSSTILACAWWFTVVLSVFAADKPMLWSEDAWPKMIWPMLASVLLVAPHWNAKLLHSPAMWIVFGWIAIIAAILAMPIGEAWADTQPLHQPWIAAILIAANFNAVAVHRMAQRGAQRWLPFAILAGLVCAAFVGASSYRALFETCLGAIVVTAMFAMFAASGWLPAGPAILFPSALFSSTMIAAGRFYSYDEVPAFAYGLALFAPGLVALADGLVANKSIAIRVGLTTFAGLSLVCATAFLFLVSRP